MQHIEDGLAAVANGGFVPSVSVASYGADRTGASDATAAFTNAVAAAAALAPVGGFSTVGVWVPNGRYKVTAATIPSFVKLVCDDGVRFDAGGADYVFVCSGDFGGISGGPSFEGGGDGVGASGVHFAPGSRWNEIHNARFDGFHSRAIFDEGVANRYIDCFAQNCLLGAAGLAAYTGVVEMAGTDGEVRGGEFTASRAAMSTSAKACALAITGANNSQSGLTVCEISDHGVYIGPNASDLRLIGIRADLNRGHGFIVDGGGGVIVGEALNNSQETNQTYDGVYCPGTHASNFHGKILTRSSGAPAHKYGIEDQQNSIANYNTWDHRDIGALTAAFTPGSAGARFVFSQAPAATVNLTVTTFNVTAPLYTDLLFANTGAVNFTNFLGGVGGQVLRVHGDGFTTLVHDVTKIYCAAGANLLLAANRVYQFVRRNGVWYQV